MQSMTIGRGAVVDADASFAAAFTAYYDEALRLALLLSGDRHRAEDATGEAFAKVFRRWRHSDIAQPRAYIRRAVVNEVNSRFRKLALERRELQRRRADERGARTADDDFAERDVVLQALQRLPARQRTAVVLRYYHDLSEREIADVMRCAPGTVKSNVSRGLERLRVVLGEEVA